MVFRGVLRFKKGFWVCGSGGVFESCTFYLHDGRANRGCPACTTEPRKQNPSRVLVSYKYQLLGFDPTASSGMPFNTAKIYVGGKRRRNRVRAVNASDSPVARCIGAMLGVLLL